MSNNLYVPLQKVNRIINDSVEDYQLHPMKDAINRIPTIDPIATIDEMIKEQENTAIAEYMGNPEYIAIPARIEILIKLKQRLLSKR